MAFFGNRKGVSPNSGGDGGVFSIDDEYRMQQLGTIYDAPGMARVEGLTATGGVISDYADGPVVYRSHVFTSSGEFDVTALSSNIADGDDFDFLVVAGGGGGGDRGGGAGAGGAGGLLSSHPDISAPMRQSAITAAVRTYTITVGAGGKQGAEGPTSPPAMGSSGSPSSITYPGPVTVVTTSGGGGGANGNTDPGAG